MAANIRRMAARETLYTKKKKKKMASTATREKLMEGIKNSCERKNISSGGMGWEWTNKNEFVSQLQNHFSKPGEIYSTK